MFSQLHLTFHVSSKNHLVQHNRQCDRKILLTSFHLNGCKHFRISSTDSKLRTTLYSIINCTTGKYCSVAFSSFRLSGHTIGFYFQTQKLEPPWMYSTINSTMGKHCSVAFISMVTWQDFIYRLNSFSPSYKIQSFTLESRHRIVQTCSLPDQWLFLQLLVL